jgi:hypothetical protein
MTRCNPYRLVGGAVFMGVIFSLSACGGSSSSGFVSGPPATTTPPTTPPPTKPLPPPDLTRFNEQVAKGREDFAAIESSTLLPSAKMPVMGLASYSGVVLYKTSSSVSGLPGKDKLDKILESPSMSSDITLLANFGTDSISGNLGGFNDSTTGSFSGGVSIQNGTIFGNEFKGDLSGTVFKSGTPKSATGGIQGGFVGSVVPDEAVGALSLDLGAGDRFLGIFSAD